jgi:hypothetical protein
VRLASGKADFEFSSSTPEARRFHNLDEIDGIEFVPLEYDQACAAAFRFVNRFCRAIRSMSRSAPVNVWAMLDTIAWDCMYLRRPDLDDIWSGPLEYGDSVIYISEAVKRQFHHRFRIRSSLHEQVIHLSLDPREFQSGALGIIDGTHLLVIGNSFAHKRVAKTAEALSSAFPDQEIVCLGGKWRNYGRFDSTKAEPYRIPSSTGC